VAKKNLREPQLSQIDHATLYGVSEWKF